MSKKKTSSSARVTRRGFLKASSVAAGAVSLGAPMILRGAEAGAPSANDRLNIAVIGVGGQGRSRMNEALNNRQNIVALVDPDPKMIATAQGEMKKVAERMKDVHAADIGERAATHGDFRRLFDNLKSFDAVIIGTPDHWHHPLCVAAIKAGKHVFCEKPLTHTIGEARDLRDLAVANPKVFTQMGNQGSASGSMRRCIELIKAGAIGQVHEIHGMLGNGGSQAGKNYPQGEADPIPEGFNWDQYCGPTALLPYKKGAVHPYNWRWWYHFGSGQLGDFGCHSFNLPKRALDLVYPTKVEIDATGLGTDGTCSGAHLQFHFPARGKLDPLVLHWWEHGKYFPPKELLADLIAVRGDKNGRAPDGVLIIGEKGQIFSNPWNDGGMIKLKEDEKFKGVENHEATKSIEKSIPRSKGHMTEWLQAIRGDGRPFSEFAFGAQLTEIPLTGVLALRLGKSIEWDGEKMEVKGMPEAQKFIKADPRKNWLL